MLVYLKNKYLSFAQKVNFVVSSQFVICHYNLLSKIARLYKLQSKYIYEAMTVLSCHLFRKKQEKKPLLISDSFHVHTFHN